MSGWPLILFFFCEECYNRPPDTKGWFSIWDYFFGSSPPCWFLSLQSFLFLNLTAHWTPHTWNSTSPSGKMHPTAGLSFCFRRNLSSRVSQGIAGRGKWQPPMRVRAGEGREDRPSPPAFKIWAYGSCKLWQMTALWHYPLFQKLIYCLLHYPIHVHNSPGSEVASHINPILMRLRNLRASSKVTHVICSKTLFQPDLLTLSL